MKTSRFKMRLWALLVLLAPALLLAGPGKEFTKTIEKEFSITRDGTVSIANKYGSIEVRTWNESGVKIGVTIKADARNQDAADDIFKRISVTFDNSAAFVRAKTEIETVTGWKSWLGLGSDSGDFEINYIVHMPSTTILELENKYGDIYVPDMDSRASINLKYGDMKIGNIHGSATVSMAYADGSIQSTGDLNLDISYSEIYLGNTGSISLDGKYSDMEVETAGNINARTAYIDVKIQKMGRLTYVGKYDDFVIDDLTALDVNTKYSSFHIGQLREYADFQMSYGSVSINHVYPGFQSIDVSASYTDVTINVDENAAFNLDASTKYCDVEHHGLEIYQDIDKSMEKTVKGYRGSRDASARITARMSYGELTIR